MFGFIHRHKIISPICPRHRAAQLRVASVSVTQPCLSPLLDLSCEKENNPQIPVRRVCH